MGSFLYWFLMEIISGFHGNNAEDNVRIEKDSESFYLPPKGLNRMHFHNSLIPDKPFTTQRDSQRRGIF